MLKIKTYLIYPSKVFIDQRLSFSSHDRSLNTDLSNHYTDVTTTYYVKYTFKFRNNPKQDATLKQIKTLQLCYGTLLENYNN